MLLTCKNLQQETFQVEVGDSVTVSLYKINRFLNFFVVFQAFNRYFYLYF